MLAKTPICSKAHYCDHLWSHSAITHVDIRKEGMHMIFIKLLDKYIFMINNTLFMCYDVFHLY